MRCWICDKLVTSSAFGRSKKGVAHNECLAIAWWTGRKPVKVES